MIPDSSRASRSAAAATVPSPSSQCPPSCTQRPTRGCKVSSTVRRSADSTMVEAVMCPDTH